jgi:hypothetical protein
VKKIMELKPIDAVAVSARLEVLRRERKCHAHPNKEQMIAELEWDILQSMLHEGISHPEYLRTLYQGAYPGLFKEEYLDSAISRCAHLVEIIIKAEVK